MFPCNLEFIGLNDFVVRTVCTCYVCLHTAPWHVRFLAFVIILLSRVLVNASFCMILWAVL